MPHPDTGAARQPRHRQFRLDAATTALLRRLITAKGMHKACPRLDCKRARACVAPATPCFWSNHEAMQQTLRPMLRAMADAIPEETTELPEA